MAGGTGQGRRLRLCLITLFATAPITKYFTVDCSALGIRDAIQQTGVFMKKFAASIVAMSLISTSLFAQDVDTMTAKQSLSLNSGTPFTLAVTEDVDSTSHRAGDTFQLAVLNDVTIGQTVVIPKGTPATAEITWRTGKGAFGKSGKIEFSLRSMNLNGQLIPITGDFRQEGEGNTIATGIGVLAVGVFAGFITGKRARLPIGRELLAQLPQAIPFSANGKLDTSFNSVAAMAEAEGKTPLGQCKTAANALAEKKRKSALKDCFKEQRD